MSLASQEYVRREVTDPIRPSYPVDLAVKSPPLRILERCWSLQIIRKTQGGLFLHRPLYSSPLPPRPPSNPFPHFVASAGTSAPVGMDLWACVGKNLVNASGENGSGCASVCSGFFYDVGLHCSEIKAWCASWWGLRCIELWDPLLMKCWAWISTI